MAAVERSPALSRPSKVLILGKLPPPFIGPAIATQIILGSRLAREFRLCHVNTTTHGGHDMIGRWSAGKMLSNLRICGSLALALIREKPDLALIPISQATDGFAKDSIFIWLCRILRCPVLIQLRGSNLKNWLQQVSRPTRAYVGYVISKTEGAIVLGDKLRYLFADYLSDDRVFVVPNGCNFSPPSPIVDEDSRTVRILHLSNLMSSKGIEDLIVAVAMAHAKRRGPLELHVVGRWLDEPARARCSHIIRELSPPVKFHPPATDKTKWEHLVSADIFVFTPRLPEGHPWVIVEALAAGLPIIATDRGAITESVLDGVNGFIVEANNPEQIAERLQVLVSDHELRRKMGRASRQLYESKFTEGHMADGYAAVFNSVIARSHL